jgi:two-component system phosphate regulon sensor histidine kinase PhoR
VRSLQWRLVIPLSLFLAVSLVALGFFVTSSYRNDQETNLYQRLRQEASMSGRAILPYLSQDSEAIDQAVKQLGDGADVRLTIINPDGNVLGDSLEDPATMDNHLLRPEVQGALSDGYGQSSRYSSTLGYSMVYVAVSIQDAAGQTVIVSRVALPQSQVGLTTGRILDTVAIAVVVVLLLALVGTIIVSHLVTRPVSQLTKEVRRLSSGEMGLTASINASGEIGELAQAFNAMSLRLAGLLGQLSADKNRLTAILSHIADGVILCDLDGKLVLFNDAAARIFDFGNKVSPGQPVIEAVLDHEVDELLRQTRRTGQESISQFESITNRRYLQAIAVPLKYDGSRGVLFLFQDLTELRELQTMRKDLIGNISHEFRTPLAGIRAVVETLEDGALDEPSVAMEFLGKIRGEVDRLTQMVSELTELSQIESKRTELHKEKLDINSLISEVAEQLSPLAARASLNIETSWSEEPLMVSADREKIRRVLSTCCTTPSVPPAGRPHHRRQPSAAGRSRRLGKR